MRYCPFCGSGLQEVMAFCPRCGKRFLDAVENPETIDFRHGTSVTTCGVVEAHNSEALEEVNRAAAEKEDKRTSKGKRFWVAVAVVLVIFGIAFFGLTRENDSTLIADAANAVVYLEIYAANDQLVGTASGFLVEASDERLLITNYHVIQEARKIVARSADGKSSADVYLVLDYDEVADLAVLRCDRSFENSLLLLADSDEVRKGDGVFTVGYPLGLVNTLAEGIVSSRYIDENGLDVIQVTAAVSEGNSGGPLLNEDGYVIGVVCGSYVDGQNLNVAIASNTLCDMLDEWTAIRETENLMYWKDRPEMR